MNYHYVIVLVSAAALGIANIFYKKSTALIGSINTTFFYYLFGFVFAFLIWLFFREPGKLAIENLRYPILISIFITLSVTTFTLGLAGSKVSISSTIRSLSFLVTLVLSMIVFKEKLSVRQYVGIATAVVSILLMTG